jgi:uncharacterized protein YodC (DUF2158 family)
MWMTKPSPGKAALMPDREFAVGDRVRSISGGPEMLIEEVYPPAFQYRYRCVWFDSDGSAKSELFKEAELNATDRHSD